MLLRMGEFIVQKHVELIEIINKIIIVASSWLFILLYQWCTVTQRSKLQHLFNTDFCRPTNSMHEATSLLWNSLFLLQSSLHSKVKPIISVTNESDLPLHVPSHNSVKPVTKALPAPQSVKTITPVHVVTVVLLTSRSHWIRAANSARWNWHHLLMRQTPCYSEQTVILRRTCGTRGMGNWSRGAK